MRSAFCRNLEKGFLLLFLIIFSVIQAQEHPAIRKITDKSVGSLKGSNRKYLLLDSTIIEKSVNVQLQIGSVKKFSGNPLIKEDKPWEPRMDNMYPNVIYDAEEKVYKCWYNPFIINRPGKREMGMCYAISADGIHWGKPMLNIYPWEGNPSNIILTALHGGGIFKDLIEKDPGKRYKMFYRNDSAKLYPRSRAMAVLFSKDGIHWGKPTNINIMLQVEGDTHNNAFWAPTLNKYVGITREWYPNGDQKGAIRLVSRTESRDFINWSHAEVVFKGLEDNLQIYSMPVLFYQGIYIGLPSIFNLTTDRVHTELAWSKDTRHWSRISPGIPLIPTSDVKGDNEWGCIFAAVAPIVSQDDIKIYYASCNGPHGGQRQGFFNLSTLRSDGFAGYVPIDNKKESSITTTLLSWNGEAVTVSADVFPTGSLQVRLLDKEGNELAKSIPLKKLNLSAEKIVWDPQLLLPTKKINSVRLKFTFKDAKIYSFGIVKH